MLRTTRFKNHPRLTSKRVLAILVLLAVALSPTYVPTAVSADGCAGCPTPTFEAARSFATRPGTTSIVTGQFDHDGKLDIAVLDADGMGIMLGDGAGNFGAPNWHVFNSGLKSSPVAADVNNDGHLDLGFVDSSFDNARFFHGDGAGGFSGSYVVVHYTDGWGSGSIDAADLNKDGWIDVLGSYPYSSDALGYVTFNSAGDFTNPVALYSWGVHSLQIYGRSIADFNRDGNPDVALVGIDLGGVYLGDGAGHFGIDNYAPSYFFDGYRSTADLVPADLNGDGHVDLVADQYVLQGDGSGGFTYIASPPERRGPFKLSDMNLDGRLDLVRLIPDGISILPGGGGVFGAPTNIDTPVHYIDSSHHNSGFLGLSSTWMSVGDFNSDGRPDMATVGDGTVNVLLNTTPLTPGAPAVATTATGPGSVVTTPDTSLTFPNVTMAGTTTVEPAPEAAANYSLSENLGSYEIETTAAYSTAGYYDAAGNVADPTKGIKVTFDVPSVNDPAVFAELVVSHGEDINGDGVLEMVPYNGSVNPLKVTHRDFATRTVWVYVPHLSPFVVVKGPADQIADLVALVKTYNLRQGISNSFDAKLENAQKALSAAKGADRATACNQMAAFISEANAQSGKALTAAQTARLVGAAKGVRLLLGCQ